MSYRALRFQCAITDWHREQDVNRALTKTVGARLALDRSERLN
jgi:hypothetical protein